MGKDAKIDSTELEVLAAPPPVVIGPLPVLRRESVQGTPQLGVPYKSHKKVAEDVDIEIVVKGKKEKHKLKKLIDHDRTDAIYIPRG